MTDYIYSLSLAAQTKGFLFSLGFGFLMGAVYDMFRIVRIAISKGKKTQIFFDIVVFFRSAFHRLNHRNEMNINLFVVSFKAKKIISPLILQG